MADYERVNWQNDEIGGTPLSADNLNIMDEGIAKLDAKVPFRFGVDGDGNYGYYKADDSFAPFKSGGGGSILTGSINTNGKTYIGKGQELSQIFLYQTTGGAMIEFDSSYNATQYRRTVNGEGAWFNIVQTTTSRYAIGKDSGGYYYYDTNASAYPLRYFAVVK